MQKNFGTEKVESENERNTISELNSQIEKMSRRKKRWGRNEDLTTGKEKKHTIEKKASTKKNNKRNKMFENRSYWF